MKKEGGKWLPKCVSCLTGSPRGQRPKARAAEASLWLPPSKRPSVQRLLWCSCFCGLLSAAASLPHPHPLRLLTAGHTVTPGPVHPLDLPAALGTFLPPLCHCLPLAPKPSPYLRECSPRARSPFLSYLCFLGHPSGQEFPDL